LVEREDEVGLRLDVAVEIVGERRVVEGDPAAQQVLLQHRLAGDLRKPGDQALHELGTAVDGRAHMGKVSGISTRPLLWLGGMSGVGKTTAARAVARRYDLWLYSLDARTYAHAERLPADVRSPESLW